MKAVVMCAGLSTRLKPLTDLTPKPMLVVGGKPMIEYVIINLINQGFNEIIITLHYKSEVVIEYFKNWKYKNSKIFFSIERELLGTAGSLKKIRHLLTSDFLICSGSYFPIHLDLKDVYNFHKKMNGIGTIVLSMHKNFKNLGEFGQALINNDHKIINFAEKPALNFSSLVHSTYQFYSVKIFEYINDSYCSLPEHVIPKIISKKEDTLYSYIFSDDLLSISTLERYREVLDNVDIINNYLY